MFFFSVFAVWTANKKNFERGVFFMKQEKLFGWKFHKRATHGPLPEILYSDTDQPKVEGQPISLYLPHKKSGNKFKVYWLFRETKILKFFADGDLKTKIERCYHSWRVLQFQKIANQKSSTHCSHVRRCGLISQYLHRVWLLGRLWLYATRWILSSKQSWRKEWANMTLP